DQAHAIGRCSHLGVDHLMDAAWQTLEDFGRTDRFHRHPNCSSDCLPQLLSQAVLLNAGRVCSTIDSSTSRSWSLPKNISLPTKKVGEPNSPRATASLVLSISFFLTSSCCARAIRRSISMPDDAKALRKTSGSSIFFGASHM